MKKIDYLKTLQKELNNNHVAGIDEILVEYDEHFNYKIADGYSEEEIAAKLGKPEQIAAQFAAMDTPSSYRRGNKILAALGFGFLDLFIGIFFILAYVWVIGMGVFSITAILTGFSLGLNFNPGHLVPFMPWQSAVLFGISILFLGFLAALGTIYLYFYIRQLGKAFVQWQKNTFSGNMYPPLSTNPLFSSKARRFLRSAAQISLLVFGIALIAAYIFSAIHAGNLEFWHVWHWFV